MDRSNLAAIWLEKGPDGPYRILGRSGHTSVFLPRGPLGPLPEGMLDAARVARAASDMPGLKEFFACVPDEVVPPGSRVLFVNDVHESAGFTVLIETDNPADGAAALDIKRRVAAALVQIAEDQRRRLGNSTSGGTGTTGTAG